MMDFEEFKRLTLEIDKVGIEFSISWAKLKELLLFKRNNKDGLIFIISLTYNAFFSACEELKNDYVYVLLKLLMKHKNNMMNIELLL